MEQIGSHWTDFHETRYLFFEKLSRKFKFHENRTKIMGTLHEDYQIFLSYLAQFFS